MTKDQPRVDSPTIERALISVSDKQGLAEFAHGLAAAGVELYSTGGTHRYLRERGLPVIDVADYTGFPEMLDGRVKTLHPKVHGGILARRDQTEDVESLRRHDIKTFELVVVNLYPFERTVMRADVSDAEAIEQIDIGGPSLLRAAAKNHAFVTVVTSPNQYAAVLQQVASARRTTFGLRRQLAGAAFERTESYDRAIADYFACEMGDEEDGLPGPFSTYAPAALEDGPPAESSKPDPVPALPDHWQLQFKRKEPLRYGENPHQRAALYAESGAAGANLVSARQLHGKELSYNNLLDLDAALALVRGLEKPAVVVIKHNNPCGAAACEALAAATRRALDGDPLSAFGSVLGFNRPLDAASAEVLAEPGRFVEAIVAPGFSPAALEILTTRPKWKANVRLMEVGGLGADPPRWDFRRLAGGMLVQDADVSPDDEAGWKTATKRQATAAESRELGFAWSIVRHVKSNAIVACKDETLLGVGAGQMSRVDSVEIALKKAGAAAGGAVLASDAFFPFADSIVAAVAAGVTALVQPGGSRNDNEVIAACDERGLAMIFTGRRHFKH